MIGRKHIIGIVVAILLVISAIITIVMMKTNKENQEYSVDDNYKSYENSVDDSDVITDENQSVIKEVDSENKTDDLIETEEDTEEDADEDADENTEDKNKTEEDIIIENPTTEVEKEVEKTKEESEKIIEEVVEEKEEDIIKENEDTKKETEEIIEDNKEEIPAEENQEINKDENDASQSHPVEEDYTGYEWVDEKINTHIDEIKDMDLENGLSIGDKIDDDIVLGYLDSDMTAEDRASLMAYLKVVLDEEEYNELKVLFSRYDYIFQEDE